MPVERFEKSLDRVTLNWLRIAENIVAVLIILFLFLNFGLGIAVVTGDAMSPTMDTGDIIVYVRWARNAGQGDIVALKMADGEFFVRRVVAEGEQWVKLEEGRILVNGQEESYIPAGVKTEQLSDDVTFPLKVPQGRLFVLGDNRAVSMDSRTCGVVSKSMIIGKVIFTFDR